MLEETVYYKKYFNKINFVGALASIVALLLGGYLSLYISNKVAFSIIFKVLGGLYIMLGCVGLIGALHSKKEIPEGEYACYAVGGGAYSLSLNITLAIASYMLTILLCVFRFSYIDGVVIFSIVSVVLLALSMYGFFKNKTYGIIYSEECIYVLTYISSKRINFKDIEGFYNCYRIGGYKALDYSGKELFKWGLYWDNARKICDDLEKRGICFK